MNNVVVGIKCGGDPNGNGHDCNAAIKTNKDIFAIQAERLDRIKKSGGWKRKTKEWWKKDRESEDFIGSKLCIEYCLEQVNAQKKDVSLVVVDDIPEEEKQKEEIEKCIGENVKYYRISHHLAHASSAFLCSPFEEAAILVVDGGGGKRFNDKSNAYEYERQSFYIGKGNKLKHIHTTWSNEENIWGLGGAYSLHQKILALDAGKLMGLAPYGKGELYNDFKIFKKLTDIDILMEKYMVDDNDKENIFVRKENNVYKLYRDWMDDPVEQKWSDIAYKIQSELEENIIYLCNKLYEITHLDYLCIAGGVGLNSVANYKILKNTPFKKIFIQPASDDSGIGLGCALYGYHVLLDNPRDYEMKNAFLGKKYTDNEIIDAINKHEKLINCTEIKDITSYCAKKLSERKIIAWFQGASEYGPRALGNRSLLCDPRNIELRDKMNLVVKGREWWRPLAPSVLEEHVTEYFEINCESPFMLLVANVKKDKLDKVPAIVHIDNTARLHTVTKEQNPLYWELINKFYNITGIPLILNTSFNINNEPIVESPEDALETFIKCKHIDLLVIGNFLIEKK